ncbi:MAG TPA: hypothetical protein VE978_26545 [Chitinophagales bacterium]|nr:hypothetical protein [Chitinophagales bacterium]
MKILLSSIVKFLILVLLTSAACAQITFQKTFSKQQIGGFWSSAVSVQTFDGGYAVIAATGFVAPDWPNVFLLKTDENGTAQWTLDFGDTMQNIPLRLQQTSDSGLIISGMTARVEYNSGFQLLLSKVTSSGQLAWSKYYTQGGVSESPGYWVEQTRDGGFIVTGEAGTADSACGPWTRRIYLLKTNSEGSFEWAKTFSASINALGYCVQQTSDNGYIITGVIGNSYTDDDIALIKTDSAGTLEWAKRIGGSSCDEGYCVRQTSDLGYLVTGYTKSFDSIDFKGFLLKTDASGSIQSFKTFEAGAEENGTDIELTSDGGYMIAGTRADTFAHGFIIKFDSVENLQCSKSLSGIPSSVFSSIHSTNDGGFILSGMGGEGIGGDGGIILVKTDDQGNTTCDMIHDATILLDEPYTDSSTFEEYSVNFTAYDWSVSVQQILVHQSSACVATNTSEEEEINQSLQIFPNPASDFISVKFESRPQKILLLSGE